MLQHLLKSMLILSVLAVACMPSRATPSSPLATQPPSSLQGVSPLPIVSPAPAQSMFITQATAAAEATAFTIAHAPTPIPPTSTPLPDGTTCYVNRLADFTLKLLPGWRTESIWDTQPTVSFYNFHTESFGSRKPPPPNWAAFVVSVYFLPADKSFDQWLSERRALEEASIPISLTLSEPYSYTLGYYQGVSYTIAGGDEKSLSIKLNGGSKVIDIGLIPAQSLAIDEALSILSTLDISGKDNCE